MADPGGETLDLRSMTRPVAVDRDKGPSVIERSQEHTRQTLTKWMTLGIFGLAAIIIATAIIAPDKAAAVSSSAGPIFSGIIGVYGTMIGFYFGSKH